MKRLSLLLVVGLLAAACSTGDGAGTTTSASIDIGTTTDVEDTAPTSSPATGATTSTAPATDTTLDATVTPVRAQLDWVVRLFNGGPLSEQVYQERFAEVFRAQVAYEDQFVPIVRQMEAVPGEWLVVSYTELTPEQAVGVVAAGDERAQILVTVDPDLQNRISGLLVQPAGLASTPDSFENAINRLQAQGTLRMVAAQVVDGACQPIEEVAADEPMPIGSAFKLLVLGTLADAVDAGDVTWDDEITIRDELKSIPTGILQNEPDGTVRTVREVAELMIKISDNTATDHLIDLLGRERIEQHLAELGLSQPDLDIPFLTTREFAALKVGPASGLRTQYLDADEAGKRVILEQISGITVADLPITDFDQPIDPDELEWFASPNDMCAVMVHLWNSDDPAVREILTVNPGVAPEPGLWEQVAFKGGSEPGLISAVWLMVDEAGDTYVFAGSVVNPDQLLDDFETLFVMAAARDLLAVQE